MKSSLQKPGKCPLGREKGKGKRVKGFLSDFSLARKAFPFNLSPSPQGFTLSLSLLISLLVVNPYKVLAIPTRVVYSQDAQGSLDIDLKIWRGYGLTINFISTGETIKQVWIGDPSRIAFTSNGNLCQKNNENSNDSNSNCNQGSATVLFLRQITPIKFANLTSSADGNTQITIITNGSTGQKQYQFKLVPATGEPSYTSLVIKPDSERPLPIARTKPFGFTVACGGKPSCNADSPQTVPTTTATETPTRKSAAINQTVPTTTATVTPAPTPTPTPIPSPVNTTGNSQIPTAKTNTLSPGAPSTRNDANAIAYGLAIANRNGQVKPGSTTWNLAQDAIKLLRLGQSREEAVSRSGIDIKVFNQLIEWGKR